jgi:hypothetical protein
MAISFLLLVVRLKQATMATVAVTNGIATKFGVRIHLIAPSLANHPNGDMSIAASLTTYSFTIPTDYSLHFHD